MPRAASETRINPLAPALIISIAGNLYLTGERRKMLVREDNRWKELGRLESIAMLYLAETYPTIILKEDKVMFKNPFKQQPKVQEPNIKVPWSNRSKILGGLFAAGVVGSAVYVTHDLKEAHDAALLIPEAAVDNLLADDGIISEDAVISA